MLVLQRLAKSRSSCSAFQKSLPPRSVWQRLNIAWDGTVPPSSRTRLLLRVEPHGLFSWLFLDSPHLLPFSLSIPLVLPLLSTRASCSAHLSLIRSAMSSSTISLRKSWAPVDRFTVFFLLHHQGMVTIQIVLQKLSKEHDGCNASLWNGLPLVYE